MTTSKPALLKLPQEILTLILETYFGSLTVHIRPYNGTRNSARLIHRVPYFAPLFRRLTNIPLSFSILLTCRLLYKIAIQTMFEAMTIIHCGTHQIVQKDKPDDWIPVHKFKHVEICYFRWDTDHLQSCLSPNLKSLKIRNLLRFNEFYCYRRLLSSLRKWNVDIEATADV